MCELVGQKNLLQLRQRRRGHSPIGTVLVLICLLSLIAFGWCYIQIYSHRIVRTGSDRLEVLLLRALTTNEFERSSICESSVMGMLMHVRALFEANKVCQCSFFFLPSLIQHGGPPPGTNTLPQAHSTLPRVIHSLIPKPVAPDNDRTFHSHQMRRDSKLRVSPAQRK